MKIKSVNKRLVQFFALPAYFLAISIGYCLIPPKAYTQDTEEFIVAELSLEDVVNLAISNSLDIQIAQFDAQIKRTAMMKELSIFDAILNAEASYDHNKKMSSNSFSGSQIKEQKISLGIEKKLPTGTTLAFDLEDKKYETDSAYVTENPYYEATGEISLTQELGKNFFGLADRAKIKLTKLDIENSDFTSLDKIENVIFDAQRSYWNLVFKEENLLIAQDMLSEARRLYNIYQDKYILGLVEESEFLAIEALVKSRESAVEIASLDKETAKNDLLFLINRGDFRQQVKTKDALFCQAQTVDLYSSLKNAVELRRDYKRTKNELNKNKIEVVTKKNALWPEIDVKASLARNNLEGRRSGAWGNISKNNNNELFFKIGFKMPLENREARSELEKVKLEKERLLLMLKRTERVILKELNNKVNQVNTMQSQVNLFEETVKIHSKKLDEQIKRLNYGRSDADTLIRYEEDLLEARKSLANYLFRYREAILELELAQNSLLDKYWDEPIGRN